MLGQGDRAGGVHDRQGVGVTRVWQGKGKGEGNVKEGAEDAPKESAQQQQEEEGNDEKKAELNAKLQLLSKHKAALEFISIIDPIII